MENELVEDKTTVLRIDEILTRVGEFGRFQKFVDGIFCLTYFFLSFQILIMYFATLTPTWKCVSNSTCTFNGTQPGEDTRRCRFERKEWYYTEPKHYSLVTQLDIQCDREWLLGLASSIHFIGWGIGAVILGWLGDRYGRKTLMFPSAATLLIIGFVSSFLQNLNLIIAFRFVIGFCIPGVLVQANTLISETVGNKQRPLAALIPFFFFPIGYSILAVKAYYLQSWKKLFIACTAPYVIVLALYPLLPESVKWLQTHGRIDDAMNTFHKIARWNKNVLGSNIVMSSSDINTRILNTEETGRSGKIILQTLIQCFIWTATTISFFGLQLAAKELQGDMYRNFVLLGMVQFPAIIFSIIALNKFGRKKSNLISLLCIGVSCLAIAFIPARKNLIIARVTIGIIGKFFASFTIQALYIWSTEIFPTHMRSRGMGIVQVAARIGATSAPWVVEGLTPFGLSVPFVVLGVPSLIGSVIGMWLPETKVTFEGEIIINNEQPNNNINGENEVEMSTPKTNC